MKRSVDKKRKTMRRRRAARIAVGIICVAMMVILCAVALAALYVSAEDGAGFDLSLLESIGSDTVTRIYYIDENGSAVELENERLYGSQITVFTPLSGMPDDLKNAFIAIEDKRFYSHGGVDWIRTAAAGVNYITKRKSTFGASTITQQLIKNVTGNDEVKLERKLKEIFFAMELEDKVGKDEILEMYLNIINLSEGCYGVGAAAEKYFSKSVSELSLCECAAIAAITKNPSAYDPIKHPEANRKRRGTVLYEMMDQGYISREEYDAAVAEELVLKVSGSAGNISSWYTDMVVEDVIRDLESELGYTRAAASYLVYNGGLSIYTAQSPSVQAACEKIYADVRNFPADDTENGRSAVIVIDAASGDILGVAGAVGEKSANRIQNYATDTRRPSGSSVKPLSVYAPALEEGIITWASVYDDVPLEFSDDGKVWPNNATMTFRGLTDISCAVENSLNTVAVKTLYDLGIERSYDYLTRKFHISGLSDTDKVPAALALGQETYGVTLRDMSAAYTVFADRGIYHEPRSYYMVLGNGGGILLDKTSASERVISEGNAFIMTKMLQKVTSSGTAGINLTLRKEVAVAGKTGTTQDTCDRWFIGYTPEYVCGIWYGHEYPSPLPSSANSVCTKVWNSVMKAIYAGRENVKTDFDMPDNVIEAEYCKDSGKLMTGACLCDARGNRSAKGWFIDGTQPKSFCKTHTLVLYDEKGGGVAGFGCPASDVVAVGLIKVERNFPTEIYVADAQYTARDVKADVPPCSENKKAYFAYSLPEGEYPGITETGRQFNSACPLHNSYSDWIFGRSGG